MITYRDANSMDIPVLVSLDKELFPIHLGRQGNIVKRFLLPHAVLSWPWMKDKVLLVMQVFLHLEEQRQIF